MGVLFSVLGNFLSTAILLGGDIASSLVTWFTHRLVDVVDCICGSGKNTARRKVAWHGQRCVTAPVYKTGETAAHGELNVEAMMARSTFPFKPEELMAKAREIMKTEFGTVAGCDASILAEDFQFVAPIIGPLSKVEFLKAFGSFKLKDAVPDMKENFWFQVDPLEPNRVWFFGRTTGTHTGTLAGMYAGKGQEIRMPPQASSMLFDESGKCYTLTVGYCMDKRIGNTAGLGAVLGILKAIGKPLPFPEGQRSYNPSLRFEAFEHVAKAFEGMGFDTASRSKVSKSD